MYTKKRTAVTGQMITALLELMKEKPFAEISVSEMVRKAGVSRASFYRNFHSTNDVLEVFIDDLMEKMSKEVVPVFEANNERLWRDCLFRLIYSISDPLNPFMNINPESMSFLFGKINKRIQEHEKENGIMPAEKKYRIAAGTGAITNTVRIWIDSGMTEPAEELVDFLVKTVMRI